MSIFGRGGSGQVNISALPLETQIDDADLVAIYDQSAAAEKSMTRADFLAGLQTSGGGIASTVSKIAGQNLLNPLRPVCIAPDGKVVIAGNNEGQVTAFLGLNKTTANQNQSIDIYLPYQRVTGFSGLVTGAEYWVHNGGLVPYDAIPAGGWCRPIGVADTGTSMVLTLGEVIQKPQQP